MEVINAKDKDGNKDKEQMNMKVALVLISSALSALTAVAQQRQAPCKVPISYEIEIRFIPSRFLPLLSQAG